MTLPSKPLEPTSPNWQLTYTVQNGANTRSYRLGDRCPMFVLSTHYPHGLDGASGEVWHLSVSCLWRRPYDDEMKTVRTEFGASGVEWSEAPVSRNSPACVRHIYHPPQEAPQ